MFQTDAQLRHIRMYQQFNATEFWVSADASKSVTKEEQPPPSDMILTQNPVSKNPVVADTTELRNCREENWWIYMYLNANSATVYSNSKEWQRSGLGEN